MAIVVASSASYSDVASAVAGADPGDTVQIPSGEPDWGSNLVTINKELNLAGAGKTATVLAGSAENLRVAPGANVDVRVSGIGLDGGSMKIIGSSSLAYCLSKVRVDHMHFEDSNDSIWVQGWVEGLIDHNSFLDCTRNIMMIGDNSYTWARTIAAGTSHALFIEDNEFELTADGNDTEIIYHQEGARSVLRYNSFLSSYLAGWTWMFDSHGNWSGNYGGYSGPEGSGYRGQPILEIYENIFAFPSGTQSGQVFIIRSGSGLLYNNVITGNVAYLIKMYEEEAAGGLFSPLRSAWPAQDQITNWFIWNNTSSAGSLLSNSNPTFIQEDRDYFLHAPESSGGRGEYSGRAGGSTTYPTDGTLVTDSGTLAFNGEVANAFYPYTAYTYPHPLQGGGVGIKLAMFLK